MAAKYEKLYRELKERNPELIAEFRILHAEFAEDPKANKKKFDEVGQKVVDLITTYVDELCRTSEGSKFARFSSSLSELFWNEVREEFPEIVEVGVETE